ncbi:MAG: cyclic nucleotide-binding domain-containing protein [Candidatus Acetothermia bacterium]|jgi:CRP-like cAMP-binding protein|nr:cyclic nucleotide-binding domain-containing protein [Candidatus Acetothermia bacterium]MDH7505791.1 cyclic nucleotide-binding domain-containing protein [Candidatus Acetothermia bacterium]
MRDGQSPLSFLDAGLAEEVYRRGQFIYLPGDPSDAVYLIRKGRVRLSFESEDGERQTMAILGPGELFGELVLKAESPREFYAEALTETAVYVLDKWQLLKLIRGEPELRRRLSELLGYKRDLLFLCQP